MLQSQMGLITSCMFSGNPASMIMAMHPAGATASPACAVARNTQCGMTGFRPPNPFPVCIPTFNPPPVICRLDNATAGGGLPVELMEFSVEDEPEPDADG